MNSTTATVSYRTADNRILVQITGEVAYYSSPTRRPISIGRERALEIVAERNMIRSDS